MRSRERQKVTFQPHLICKDQEEQFSPHFTARITLFIAAVGASGEQLVGQRRKHELGDRNMGKARAKQAVY